MADRAAPDEQVVAVLATLTAAQVHETAATLSAGDLAALAAALGVPRRLLLEDAAAARILLRRTRSLAPATRPEVALLLAATCNDDTVAALGPRHEDPSLDDMAEVLDAIVERHGRHAAALMLAAYVDSVAPCAPVFAEILGSDARFDLASLAPDDVHEPGGEGGQPDAATTATGGTVQPEETGESAEAREARRRDRRDRERAAKERRAHEAAAIETARRRAKEARRRSRG